MGGLARGDHLRSRTSFDVGELRLSDHLGGKRLLVLGERLGIVDPHQHRVGGNVLPARNRDLGDAPIDARREIKPRGVNLALHQQRLAADQIPEREHYHGRGDHAVTERDQDERAEELGKQLAVQAGDAPDGATLTAHRSDISHGYPLLPRWPLCLRAWPQRTTGQRSPQ